MKALSFITGGRASFGVSCDDGIIEAGRDFRRRFADLRAVLEAGALDELAETVEDAPVPGETVSFLPPVPNPDKVFCIGVNYRPHLVEMRREPSRYPVVFLRTPGSLVGHREAIVRPSASDDFDYEGEVAVVIGRRGRHIGRDDALDHVAGISAFMDGSVRDWQTHTSQFTPGKNFAASGAMGPWLVTPDEWPDPAGIAIETHVNGARVQQGSLGELIFDIPSLIEYLSTFAELLPGDVIATGTPGGVGAARTPPAWLVPGDTVEVAIPGIARLVNEVRDE